MLGLNSLGNYPDGGGIGSNNPMTGAYDPENGPGNGSGSRGAGNIPPRAFSEPHTEKQAQAARKYGIDISDMSKGDASLALDKAGMDKSYWRGSNPAGGGASGTIDKSNPTSVSYTHLPYYDLGYGSCPVKFSDGSDKYSIYWY